MDWEKTATAFYASRNLDDLTYMQAVGKNRSREILRIEKERADVRRAMDAVKQAWEENPNANRAQLEKKAYKFITGGVILTLLLQVLLSATMKLAIDYFLDKLFQEKADAATLQVSSE